MSIKLHILLRDTFLNQGHSVFMSMTCIDIYNFLNSLQINLCCVMDIFFEDLIFSKSNFIHSILVGSHGKIFNVLKLCYSHYVGRKTTSSNNQLGFPIHWQDNELCLQPLSAKRNDLARSLCFSIFSILIPRINLYILQRLILNV